jgi:hypothetical protein
MADGLPSLVTMTIMTSTTICVFTKSLLTLTAVSVYIFRTSNLSSCHRININRTELLLTFPAPRATTACTDLKAAVCV